MNTPTVEANPRIIDFGNGVDVGNIVLFFAAHSHELTYYKTASPDVFCVAPSAFPREAWKQVAVVHSGGTVRLYVDGVEVQSCAMSQPPAGTRSVTYVAKSHWGPGDSMSKVLVRELAMWDRAVSVAEMTALRGDASLVGSGVLLRAYCIGCAPSYGEGVFLGGPGDYEDLGPVGLDGGTAVSFSFWVLNSNTVGVEGWPRVIDIGNGPSTEGGMNILVYLNYATHEMSYGVGYAGNTGAYRGTSEVFPTGVWAHVGISHDGGAVTIYWDSAVKLSAAAIPQPEAGRRLYSYIAKDNFFTPVRSKIRLSNFVMWRRGVSAMELSGLENVPVMSGLGSEEYIVFHRYCPTPSPTTSTTPVPTTSSTPSTTPVPTTSPTPSTTPVPTTSSTRSSTPSSTGSATPVVCAKQPLNLKHGRYMKDCKQTPVGGTCPLRCQLGFIQTGNATCLANGRWHHGDCIKPLGAEGLTSQQLRLMAEVAASGACGAEVRDGKVTMTPCKRRK
eukprot:NODE_687_length_1980_cov_86.098395_g635_i0.p1 GENE.NODE_687_length_1980_cov_86.098395_g635_i0~~NODE_687_length_1980_cov_86.098395_g635_i0.p1  ORF type:complete len:569 (-),score=77.13 NODE_687_length_1980_cov_86.098395_g635_i0:273-1775(-)